VIARAGAASIKRPRVESVRLKPFQLVDDMPFTASREDVVRVRGKPALTQRNRVSLTELDYGSVVDELEQPYHEHRLAA
jgi:hypothetical protein